MNTKMRENNTKDIFWNYWQLHQFIPILYLRKQFQ